MWLHLRGAPVVLETSDGASRREFPLGGDPATGAHLQHVVREGEWQRAHSLGPWTLVSCVVVPEFRFEGFELAPDGWEPGG
jgi:uncharacterized protein